MSFSFRSMFQGSADPTQQGGAALHENGMLAAAGPAGFAAAPAMMPPASSPPLNAAASPFGAPLFKVAPGENATGAGTTAQPSPFAAAGAASGTNAPLTVGDVLPQLPPEVARAGALPPDQPVALSSQTLDEALRSGQAAVPMFEIYRVCPALFQTPVSPQDPRMIPLPASKLPRLIAAAQSGVQTASPAPNTAPSSPPMNMSPFGTASPAPAAGGMMIEAPALLAGSSTPSGMLLPPRRQGPPPPLAEVGSREHPPQVALPGSPAFPASPFSAAGPPETVSQPAPSPGQPFSAAPAYGGNSPFSAGSPQTAPSPFSTKPENFEPAAPPQPGPASPFAAAAPPSAASPFSSPVAMPATASPFAAAGQNPGTGTSGSPFGSLFGDKAVPTGQPAPDAPFGAAPRMVSPAPMGMPQSAPAPSPASTGPVRISLAGLLKGYTAAELGFDPMVVPAWITTIMPGSTAQELLSSPSPLAQLGLLVDGITDVGFRNVLNTARRDFQLRINPEIVQNALAGNSAQPTLPNLSSLGAAPNPGPGSAAGGPKPGVMRVEPPPGFIPAQPQSTAPTPFGPGAAPGEASAPVPANAFLSPPPSGPLSGAPQVAATSPFQSAPAPAAFQAAPFQPAPVTPPPQAAAPVPTAFGTLPGVPVTPPQDPFAAPPPQAQAAAPFSPPPLFSTPIPAAAAVPVMETTVLPPENRAAAPLPPFPTFKPPVVQETGDTGFSSDQLLGQNQPPPMLERAWSKAAAATGSLNAPEPPIRHAPVIDVPSTSAAFFDPPPAEELQPTPATRAFVPPSREEMPFQAPVAPPAPAAPQPRAAKAASGSASNTSLGVQTHDANPDQIMLRALLDTDAELTAQRVVELTCGLPGIAACVCIHNGQSISHVGAHKPQAREFQKQATQLAQHLRALAPLIGIDGAETFTMNSGDRLMTFCFPEDTILGVLHDAEPTLGLRDKITLIARELSRMIA